MVLLRDVRYSDKDMIHQWRNLPEVASYMYTDHEITKDEHEKWFSSAMSDPQRKYWIIVCDNEDVGLANIYDRDDVNKRCYWAFYIASTTVRGKGVGSFVEYSVLSYVFDRLKMNKLCCEVLAQNDAVVKMHQRFGFRQEGYFREHIFKNNNSYDVVTLAMLGSDWIERRPAIVERLEAKGLLVNSNKGTL